MSKKLTGKEIRTIRTSNRIGQKDFALLLGFKSYAWISAMENEKAKISERTAMRIRHLQEKGVL